jgi:NADH-ubiquinone oxidoreductase chain 4
MYFLIGIFGKRYRRVKAAYYLVIYTLLGSVAMLLAIVVILLDIGTTNLYILLGHTFSFERQLVLWLSTFLSFSVKIPVVPFHLWLPEAHVEAPTVGSVILAGLLLKLGFYGFVRFSCPL